MDAVGGYHHSRTKIPAGAGGGWEFCCFSDVAFPIRNIFDFAIVLVSVAAP